MSMMLMPQNQETKEKQNSNQWTKIMDANITIGPLLRGAREAKGHSLKKISQNTKINLTLLEALEEDRLDKLPNKAYVMGFVKAYAQIVGVTQQDCIEALNRTYTNGSLKPKKSRSNLLKSDSADDNSPAVAMGLALVVLVLIGFTAIFLNSNRDKIVARPEIVTQKLTETTPLKIEATQGITPKIEEPSIPLPDHIVTASKGEYTPVDQGKSLEEKILAVGEAEIVKDTDLLTIGHATEIKLPVDSVAKVAQAPVVAAKIIVSPAIATPITEVKKVETPKVDKALEKERLKEIEKEKLKEEEKVIEFKPITEEMYTTVEKGASEALKAYVPSNIQASVIKEKQNVFITAVDGDTWITYKKDNDPIKRFTLMKERNILIRGNEVRVFLGNANVTRVFLNNKLLDVSSKNGIKSLVFPKENSSKYQVPLFIYENGQMETSDDYLKNKKP